MPGAYGRRLYCHRMVIVISCFGNIRKGSIVMQSAISGSTHYMKGKTKHWFWPMLVFLLFSTVLQQSFQSIVSMLTRGGLGSDLLGIAVIAVPLLLDGLIFLGWGFLLVMYGIGNTVKTYQALLFVLILFQLFGAIGEFIFHRFLFSVIFGQYHDGEMGQTLNNISTALYVVANAAWLICMLVIVFSKKTNGVLRAAALLVALFYLYISVYTVASPQLLNALYERLDGDIYSVLLKVINVLHALAYVAANAFFFAAMSFGRARAPKAAVLPAESAATGA